MDSFGYQPFNSQTSSYLDLIWEVKGYKNSCELILPKGIIELVFNLGGDIQGLLPFHDQPSKTPKAFIQGINTHVVTATYTGLHHLFGIRLKPDRVEELFGILPSELVNTAIDCTLLKKQFSILYEQLIEANTFAERVQIVEHNFPLMAESTEVRKKKFTDLFGQADLQPFSSVENLAREVCYSPRQLSRISHQLFGMSAEELISYKKFLTAVQLVHSGNQTLTEVAYNSGFYDQAHFCKSFKSLSGITANQYRKSKSELPGHIFS